MSLAPSSSRRSLLVAGVALALSLVACGGAPESVGAGESGLSANDQVAFDFFLGKGLTPVQAAGIVGNLDQESSMTPTAVEPGGPGRGIAQWSAGARWNETSGDNASWYAQKEGLSVTSLQLQLDFLWYELTTFPVYGLAALERDTTVSGATNTFAASFEACGTCNESQRISFAEAALRAYGGDGPSGGSGTSGSSSGSTGTACFVSSLGLAGQCMLTSACGALPDHVSTAGYCPGAADVECCTGPSDTDAGDSDAGDDADAGT